MNTASQHPMFRLMLLLLLALTSFETRALTNNFCVNDIEELEHALSVWAYYSDDDHIVVIRIVQGTYHFTPLFEYEANSNATLRLLGGYNAGCGTRTLDPTNTVLDGSNIGTSVDLELRDGSVKIEGLTFKRYNGVSVTAGYNTPSEIFIKHSIFRDGLFSRTAGYTFGGIGGGTRVRLENLLIVNNQFDNVSGAPAVVDLTVNVGVIVIANVTATGNEEIAVHCSHQGDGIMQITNSILWGNGRDLDLFSNTGVTNATATNSILGSVSGALTTLAVTNADPLFVNPAAGDFRLQNGSPGINSGNMAPPTGLASLDVGGNPRVVGSKVDRGAYESNVDDLNLHEVNSTADPGNGVCNAIECTLREAISAANANTDFSKISFDIPGPCPRVIELANELPPITSAIAIDGYSQPNAERNSAETGWNANLCIAVVPKFGVDIDYAFEVPTNSDHALTMRGLSLADFQNAAIVLNGGDHHVIDGNRIGSQGFYPGNGTGIIVGGSAASTYIGHDSFETRNVIAGNIGAGILIEGGSATAVLDNLIGENGVGGQSNQVGIVVDNSGGHTICRNRISHSLADGVQLLWAGSEYNLLCNNVISENGGNGVLMDLGAKNNFVGLPAAPASDNIVFWNQGAGVRLAPGAGSGNRIFARGSANAGILIDLGEAGPTRNDVLDIDSGPNGLQNYPVITAATRDPQANEFIVQFTLSSAASSAYQVDVYWHADCDPNGRGYGLFHLGAMEVTTNGSGQSVSNTLRVPLDHLANYSRGYVSATATGALGTSEIGACTQEAELPTLLMMDGFES